MTEETYKEAAKLQRTIERLERVIHDFTCASNDDVCSDLYALIETSSLSRSALKDFLEKKLAEYKKAFDEL